MNFLFGVAQGIGSALIILFLYWIIPDRCWNLIPRKFQKWRKVGLYFVMCLSFVVIVFNSVMTYGPRIEVQKAAIPSAPIKQDIETGKQFVENRDRIGQFDKKLSEDPIEIKNEN